MVHMHRLEIPLAGFLSVALLAVLASMAFAEETQSSDLIQVRVLKKPTIEWPGQVNREALVILEFAVNADGTASDITVTNEGYYEQRFVDAAIKGMKTARFAPMIINGEPMKCSGLRMPVKFSISGQEKGVTTDFKNEAMKVSNLIKKKDFAGAQHHAQWMLAEKVTLNYEYAVLQGTMAALDAARKATARTSQEVRTFVPGEPIQPNSAANYLLPRDFVLELLELRMVLASQLGLQVEALDAYSQLAGLLHVPPEDRLLKAADRMLKLVLSDRPLVANAKLDSRGYWSQQPSRRTVTVRNIQSGELKNMNAICKGDPQVVAAAPGAALTIPGTPNECLLYFNGAPDTTFQVVETIAGLEDPQRPVSP
jgi:Gram-negative bacterial TonB protein C-terminal